ncbi:hypothetical protein DFH08DRAFT_948292 [Mycena albidolilacea]|uniref:Uncharacterized protein n=1 Tax=Mycena albidolilacea TaxID=1033008 RepID=A0AAD7F2C9_9AGAR|nr:hypothetical protein DFH08DRAFT_948292 [Mycena albidolilacea]
MASVSGPIEVRLAAENPSLSTFEILLPPLSIVPATQSKSLTASIRPALWNPFADPLQKPVHPDANRSSDSDTIALLNARSIPMKGVVCAVAIARIESSLIVDPGEDEETTALDASGCFAPVLGNGIDDTRYVWTN